MFTMYMGEDGKVHVRDENNPRHEKLFEKMMENGYMSNGNCEYDAFTPEEWDDIYLFGYSAMPKADEDKYRQQFRQSDGFDVDAFDGAQVQPSQIDEWVRNLTSWAIEEWNKKQNWNLKLEEIVKATWEPVEGIIYRITLRAKDGMDADLVKTYQLYAWQGFLEEEKDVSFIRLKSDPPERKTCKRASATPIEKAGAGTEEETEKEGAQSSVKKRKEAASEPARSLPKQESGQEVLDPLKQEGY